MAARCARAADPASGARARAARRAAPAPRSVAADRHGRAQVEALDRLRRSLDPEAPLQRGYVLVTDGAGHVVKDRASAAAQPVLTLKFADGTLDVSTGEAPASSASPARPRGRRVDSQPKLL
jgi:exodeoxyribonuclease VII large subunit